MAKPTKFLVTATLLCVLAALFFFIQSPSPQGAPSVKGTGPEKLDAHQKDTGETIASDSTRDLQGGSPKQEVTALARKFSFQSWIEGKIPQLTPAELDAFLRKNEKEPTAYLAVSILSNDLTALRKGVDVFPDNKILALELGRRSTDPAEALACLEKFHALDPDNSLGNYLLAQAHLQSHAPALLDDLKSIKADSPNMDNYRWASYDMIQNAYQTSRFSSEDSSVIAFGAVNMSQASPPAGLNPEPYRNLVAEANSYSGNGDQAAGNILLQSALNLSKQLQTQPGIDAQLVGLNGERQILSAVVAAAQQNAATQGTGVNAQQITQWTSSIDSLNTQIQDIQSVLDVLKATPISSWTPEVLATFIKTTRQAGELPALRQIQQLGK